MWCLSVWPCHLKKHFQEAVVHTEGLNLVSDPTQSCQPQPFHAAHKALCTKEHPCFRTKMFPSCICRLKAADLGQPPLHLQVKPAEMAEVHLPLPLSAPRLIKAIYSLPPLQHRDASRSVVINTMQGSDKGYLITFSFLDLSTFF